MVTIGQWTYSGDADGFITADMFLLMYSPEEGTLLIVSGVFLWANYLHSSIIPERKLSIFAPSVGRTEYAQIPVHIREEDLFLTGRQSKDGQLRHFSGW